MAEWRNGGMAEVMAEWQKEWQNGQMAGMDTYILFKVHTDNTDTDDDNNDDTFNGGNGRMAERRNSGRNGGMAERMAEWSNGGNGYIRTIYGTHR